MPLPEHVGSPPNAAGNVPMPMDHRPERGDFETQLAQRRAEDRANRSSRNVSFLDLNSNSENRNNRRANPNENNGPNNGNTNEINNNLGNNSGNTNNSSGNTSVNGSFSAEYDDSAALNESYNFYSDLSDTRTPSIEELSDDSDDADESSSSSESEETDDDVVSVLLEKQRKYKHINDLPTEIMSAVRDHLESVADLVSFMLVQRSWFGLGARRLWCKPQLTSKQRSTRLCFVLMENQADLAWRQSARKAVEPASSAGNPRNEASETQIQSDPQLRSLAANSVASEAPIVNYARQIRRLNFSHVNAASLDEDSLYFASCRNLDRLVLQGCTAISASALATTLKQSPRLQSVDFQTIPQIDDSVLEALASTATDLQVFYGGGKEVTNAGLRSLAGVSHSLRRLRLSQCPLVTADALSDSTTQCHQLVESDISGLDWTTDGSSEPAFGDWPLGSNLNSTDAESAGNSNQHSSSSDVLGRSRPYGSLPEDLAAIMRSCTSLRELRLDRMVAMSPETNDFSCLAPSRMDNSRVLTSSMCAHLNDAAFAQIIAAMPKSRQSNISKCPLITDKSVILAAETYNSGLHYSHLGHCTKITDRGVASVADKCMRLSFFDAANCSNLTNLTMFSLSKLPKLRRIGVVKCNEIGGPGVSALARRPYHGLNGMSASDSFNLNANAASPGAILEENANFETPNRTLDPSATGPAAGPSAPNASPGPSAGLAAPNPSAGSAAGPLSSDSAASGDEDWVARPNYPNDSPIERSHLSYCSSITIESIKTSSDACPRLVHLSLTGVRAFMRSDIMRSSRQPPPELNANQRQSFCVFSGAAINDSREFLKQQTDCPVSPNSLDSANDSDELDEVSRMRDSRRFRMGARMGAGNSWGSDRRRDSPPQSPPVNLPGLWDLSTSAQGVEDYDSMRLRGRQSVPSNPRMRGARPWILENAREMTPDDLVDPVTGPAGEPQWWSTIRRAYFVQSLRRLMPSSQMDSQDAGAADEDIDPTAQPTPQANANSSSQPPVDSSDQPSQQNYSELRIQRTRPPPQSSQSAGQLNNRDGGRSNGHETASNTDIDSFEAEGNWGQFNRTPDQALGDNNITDGHSFSFDPSSLSGNNEMSEDSTSGRLFMSSLEPLNNNEDETVPLESRGVTSDDRDLANTERISSANYEEDETRLYPEFNAEPIDPWDSMDESAIYGPPARTPAMTPTVTAAPTPIPTPPVHSVPADQPEQPLASERDETLHRGFAQWYESLRHNGSGDRDGSGPNSTSRTRSSRL